MTESEQLAAAQARITELEGANQLAAKENAIREALSGHAFSTPHAAAHVAKLIEPEIEIVNGVAVDAKTMRPARDAIADKLKEPGWGHFIAASPRPAASSPAGAPATNPDGDWNFDSVGQPKFRENENFGTALVRVVNARRGGGMADNPALDPSKPFGLTARRA